MRPTAVLATLVTLGVLLAVPAHADGPAEDQFLHALDQAQITYDTPQRAILDGKRVCKALAEGTHGDEILTVITTNNPTVLPWQAGAFVGASIAAFCPQHDDVSPS